MEWDVVHPVRPEPRGEKFIESMEHSSPEPKTPSAIVTALESWVNGGLRCMGEVIITKLGGTCGYELCHRDDREILENNPSHLTLFEDAAAAREISRFDSANVYRPLKTAPGLRRGWRLRVKDGETLRQALDGFYPAMAGSWYYHNRSPLEMIPLRRTLERQTGMYRYARSISDDGAQRMVSSMCRSESGCLKKILWSLDEKRALSALPASKADPAAAPDGLADGSIPMLCLEACSLIVAEARRISRDENTGAASARCP